MLVYGTIIFLFLCILCYFVEIISLDTLLLIGLISIVFIIYKFSRYICTSPKFTLFKYGGTDDDDIHKNNPSAQYILDNYIKCNNQDLKSLMEISKMGCKADATEEEIKNNINYFTFIRLFANLGLNKDIRDDYIKFFYTYFKECIKYSPDTKKSELPLLEQIKVFSFLVRNQGFIETTENIKNIFSNNFSELYKKNIRLIYNSSNDLTKVHNILGKKSNNTVYIKTIDYKSISNISLRYLKDIENVNVYIDLSKPILEENNSIKIIWDKVCNGCKYVNLQHNDYKAPSVGQLRIFNTTLNECLITKKNVAMTCGSGHGRSGFMALNYVFVDLSDADKIVYITELLLFIYLNKEKQRVMYNESVKSLKIYKFLADRYHYEASNEIFNDFYTRLDRFNLVIIRIYLIFYCYNIIYLFDIAHNLAQDIITTDIISEYNNLVYVNIDISKNDEDKNKILPYYFMDNTYQKITTNTLKNDDIINLFDKCRSTYNIIFGKYTIDTIKSTFDNNYKPYDIYKIGSNIYHISYYNNIIYFDSSDHNKLCYYMLFMYIKLLIINNISFDIICDDNYVYSGSILYFVKLYTNKNEPDKIKLLENLQVSLNNSNICNNIDIIKITLSNYTCIINNEKTDTIISIPENMKNILSTKINSIQL